jgi:hypothetical protein
MARVIFQDGQCNTLRLILTLILLRYAIHFALMTVFSFKNEIFSRTVRTLYKIAWILTTVLFKNFNIKIKMSNFSLLLWKG